MDTNETVKNINSDWKQAQRHQVGVCINLNDDTCYKLYTQDLTGQREHFNISCISLYNFSIHKVLACFLPLSTRSFYPHKIFVITSISCSFLFIQAHIMISAALFAQSGQQYGLYFKFILYFCIYLFWRNLLISVSCSFRA